MDLHMAVCSGRLDEVQDRIGRGEPVDKKDEAGRTSLMLASQYEHLAIVDFLTSHGADVNAANLSGDTPLTFAAAKGNLDIVKLLIDRNASLATIPAATTPLIRASEKGHQPVVEHLLACNADVNGKNVFGNTFPLLLAAKNGHLSVVECLVRNNAEINASNKSNGETPLMCAVKKGHLAVAQYLRTEARCGGGGPASPPPPPAASPPPPCPAPSPPPAAAAILGSQSCNELKHRAEQLEMENARLQREQEERERAGDLKVAVLQSERMQLIDALKKLQGQATQADREKRVMEERLRAVLYKLSVQDNLLKKQENAAWKLKEDVKKAKAENDALRQEQQKRAKQEEAEKKEKAAAAKAVLPLIDEREVQIVGDLSVGGEVDMVRIGRWKGRTVTVKHYLDTGGGQHREVQLLEKLRHPRVVEILGRYVTASRQELLGLVMEYHPFTLPEYLQSLQAEGADLKLKEAQRQIAYDVAVGLRHLHGREVLHGDVKGANILIGEDGRGRVANLGAARALPSYNETQLFTVTGVGPGSVQWMCKEALSAQAGQTDSSWDVYSYGVILWEIETCGACIPWEEEANGSPWAVVPLIMGGQKLKPPEGCDPVLHDTMQRCFEDAPDRPTFSQIADELARQLKGTKAQPPPELMCPLSLQLFEDPVSCVEGHLMERSFVLQALSGGIGGSRKVCPYDNVSPLTEEDLRPVINVRNMAREWRKAHLWAEY